MVLVAIVEVGVVGGGTEAASLKEKENAGGGDANLPEEDRDRDRRVEEYDKGKERRVEALQRSVEEGNRRKEEWKRMTWTEEEHEKEKEKGEGEEGEGSVELATMDPAKPQGPILPPPPEPSNSLYSLVHRIKTTPEADLIGEARKAFMGYNLYGCPGDEFDEPMPIPWTDAQEVLREVGWEKVRGDGKRLVSR